MNFSTKSFNSLINLINHSGFILKNIIVILLFLSFTTSKTLFAQDWEWARAIQNPNKDIGFDVDVDANNNVYFTGQTNNDDIYWAEYDGFGTLLNTVIVPASNLSIGKDIGVDNAGNVYVIGDFSLTANFGPGHVLNAIGSKDIFLAKYNSASNLVWVRHIRSDFDDNGEGLVIDAAGNIFITGSYSDELCFEGGWCISPSGGSAFLAKYDPSGNLVWAEGAKTGGGFSRDVAINASGEVVICGDFAGPSFTIGGTVYSGYGLGDMFLAKFQDNGTTANFQWGKAVGGAGFESAYGVAINENGDVYLTGDFEGTIDFNPAATGPVAIATAFSYDFFLVLYDKNGNGGWWTQGAGNGDIAGLGLKLDKEGNPHVSGSFEGTATFGTVSIADNGNKNSFVAKYRGDLGLISLQRSGASTGSGVAIDADGKVYTAGAYNVTADFPPAPSLPGIIGNDEAYVAKLDCIPPIADFIINYPTCAFLWIGVDGSPSQFESHFRWIITPSDQFGTAIGSPLYDTGWSAGLNLGTIFGGLQPGTYYTVTHQVKNCCGAGDSKTVVVLVPPSVIDLPPSIDVCDGNTVTLDVGIGWDLVDWTLDGNPQPQFQNMSQISVNAPGVYCASASSSSGLCQDTDCTIVIFSDCCPANNSTGVFSTTIFNPNYPPESTQLYGLSGKKKGSGYTLLAQSEGYTGTLGNREIHFVEIDADGQLIPGSAIFPNSSDPGKRETPTAFAELIDDPCIGPGNGYVVTGSYGNGGVNGNDLFLLKTNGVTTEAWSFDIPNSSEIGHDVIQDSEDNVIAAGNLLSINPSTPHRKVFIAGIHNGCRPWAKEYLFDANAFAYAITEIPAFPSPGTFPPFYAVTGNVGSDVLLMIVDALGNVVGDVYQFDLGKSETGFDILSVGNDLIITGRYNDLGIVAGTGSFNPFLLKLNILANGNIQQEFAYRYDISNSAFETAESITLSTEGNYVISGSKNIPVGAIGGADYRKAIMMEVDKNGQFVYWAYEYLDDQIGHGSTEFKNVITTTDGGFLSTGSSRIPVHEPFPSIETKQVNDIYAVKTDPKGRLSDSDLTCMDCIEVTPDLLPLEICMKTPKAFEYGDAFEVVFLKTPAGADQVECGSGAAPPPCDIVSSDYFELDSCCFKLELNNPIPNRFTKIRLSPTSASFDLIFASNCDPALWNISTVGQSIEITSTAGTPCPSGGNFIPTGFFTPLEFCLDNITQPTQSVLVEWIACDLKGCEDILNFECLPNSCDYLPLSCNACDSLCTTPGAELVVNGDFSLGNTGFTSGLPLIQGCVPFSYWIDDNARDKCASHLWKPILSPSCNDDYMIVDGANGLIWGQGPKTVIPGMTYNFAFSIYPDISCGGAPTLDLVVNGSVIQTIIPTTGTEQWLRYCASWTAPSGVNSISSISIVQTAAGLYSDYGLDDISFQECQFSGPQVILTSNGPVCEGLNILLQETGGDAVSWSWTGPGIFDDPTIWNPRILLATTGNSGTYCVTVTDADGCTNTDCIEVLVEECCEPISLDCKDFIEPCALPGPELVFNGDFSLGNTGFTSGIPSVQGCTSFSYWVDDNARDKCMNGMWQAIQSPICDGNYMIVDGLNGLIWNQNSIPVTPGVTYILGFSVYPDISGDPAPTLGLLVNGAVELTAIPSIHQWSRCCTTWTAPPGVTSISLSIIQIAANGFADYGLDDISVRSCLGELRGALDTNRRETEADLAILSLDIVNNENINVFPNPTRGVITISLEDKVFNATDFIQFFDIAGKLVLEDQVEDSVSSIAFNLQNLAPGIYSLKMKVGTEIYIGRIVKQ